MLGRDRKSIPSNKQVEYSITYMWDAYLKSTSPKNENIVKFLSLLENAPSTGRVKKEVLVAEEALSKEACTVLALEYKAANPTLYPMEKEEAIVSKIISTAKKLSGKVVTKYLYNILVKSGMYMSHKALKKEALDLLINGQESKTHVELVEFFKGILMETNDGKRFDQVRFVESESTFMSEIHERTLFINCHVFQKIRADSFPDILKVGDNISSFFGSNEQEKQNFRSFLYEKVGGRFEDLT